MQAPTKSAADGDSRKPVIQVIGLQKEYVMGDNIVHALRGVDLEVHVGEFVAVMGPSGCGKSTFMNVIGCLDRPSHGTYILNGREVESLEADELSLIRNQEIGFIFQTFNLLARTSALANVELPLLYRGVKLEERQRRARAALESVDLGDREDHLPNQLSGGQQQRVAIARALVGEPAVLLADEPTGALASRQGEEIMALFQHINDAGNTIVMVTHEPDIARHAQRIVRFRDGKVVGDENVEDRLIAAELLKTMPDFGD